MSGWKEVVSAECLKWLVKTDGIAMAGETSPTIFIRANLDKWRFEFWDGRAWFNFSNVDTSEIKFFIPEGINEQT